MGLVGLTETSGKNYHSTLHDSPEEERYHLHRGGSPQSRIPLLIYVFMLFELFYAFARLGNKSDVQTNRKLTTKNK